MNEKTSTRPQTQARIDTAAKLVAAGHSFKRTAAIVGVTESTLLYYRKNYPSAWQAAFQAARDAGGLELPRPTITPKVRERIIQATRLFARGYTLCEVARELNMKPGALADYKQSQRELWNMAQAEADKFMLDLVRSQAGTDAMLENPDRYLAAADRAEKWCTEHGRDLFEPNGDMTLEDFYHQWYVKECMVPDASESYRAQFEAALRRWKLVTGNPPLSKITNELLRRYRDFCIEVRGQQPGTKACPTTVRNKLTYIQRLLRKAGPAGWRNFDAAECIPRVPWVRLPRVPKRVPKIVSAETIGAVYKQAAAAAVPTIAGVEPAAWWRALLVTAWNTGLRRRSLFALRWEWLHADKQRFMVPPEAMKAGRAHLSYLPPIVLKHLDAIRSDRDLIFPWPYDMTHFNTMFHRLQYDAGLPRAEHFGLQTIRRALATRLWTVNPQAAMFVLGHTADTVTREHYVRGPDIVRKAIDGLPQPDAFDEGPRVFKEPGNEEAA